MAPIQDSRLRARSRARRPGYPPATYLERQREILGTTDLVVLAREFFVELEAGGDPSLLIPRRVLWRRQDRRLPWELPRRAQRRIGSQ